MGSKSKVQMFYTGDDRISSLPDPILCQILSSLPTLLVVGTSVLSTRWRYLWTSVPSLDFDDSYISTEDSDKELREKTNFMNFVEGVLDRRDSRVTLDKFSLKCRGYCDSDQVWECVCTAIQQDVKEIKLGLDLRDDFQFPTCFFVNQTLVVLRLDGKIVVDDPSEICFSNLKTLHFNGVKFMHFESVGKILCGCPVVEELVIRYCEWVQGRTLSICGLALKDVTLEDSPAVFLGMDHGCEIVIDAPALERLAIADDALEKFVVKNLCSIVEANLDLAPIENIQKFPDVKDGNRVVGFLKDVSTVKFLSLSNETLESIRFADDQSLPTFHNLTTLKLTFDAWSGWFLLPHILACSPILENLVLEGLIEHFDFQLGQFLFNWYPPEHVPDCLLLHLKEIKILNFRGIPEELIFVKYLLKNARVLRKMLIDCSFSKDGQKLREKLLTFYRGSTTCYLDLIF